MKTWSVSYGEHSLQYIGRILFVMLDYQITWLSETVDSWLSLLHNMSAVECSLYNCVTPEKWQLSPVTSCQRVVYGIDLYLD